MDGILHYLLLNDMTIKNKKDPFI